MSPLLPSGVQLPGPVGLGYLRVASWMSPGAPLVVDGIAAMEQSALRCGYHLGEVYVDDHPLRRMGWASLLDAVRMVHPVAVLVPDLVGLRLPDPELDALRARLKRATNAPLVLARPTAQAVPEANRPLPELGELMQLPVRSEIGAGLARRARPHPRRPGWWFRAPARSGIAGFDPVLPLRVA